MRMLITFLALFCVKYFFVYSLEKAIFFHNNIQDIENSKGKVQLKLIRVWGGDEEEDENKFFRIPISVAVDANKSIYICDWSSHCIKVFNDSGKYLYTIGRYGRGPGDLFGPGYIAFTLHNDLWVCEMDGH